MESRTRVARRRPEALWKHLYGKTCGSGSAQPGTSPTAQLGDPGLLAEAPCLCVLGPHFQIRAHNGEESRGPFPLPPHSRAPGEGAGERRQGPRAQAQTHGANLGPSLEGLHLQSSVPAPQAPALSSPIQRSASEVLMTSFTHPPHISRMRLYSPLPAEIHRLGGTPDT